MKKRYNTQKNRKINAKRINEILKRNEPITDFISKIILALVTISIAVTANHIAKRQMEIEEINVLSNIEINYTKDAEDMENHRIEIYNNGGPIYNVNIELYNFLHIYNFEHQIDKRVPIRIYRKSETGNQVGLIAFYEEFLGNQIDNLEEAVNNSLSENGFDFKIGLASTPYLKISYEDRFKNHTTSYFLDKSNVGTEFGMKIEKEYYAQEAMEMIIDSKEVYELVVNEYEKSIRN